MSTHDYTECPECGSEAGHYETSPQGRFFVCECGNRMPVPTQAEIDDDRAFAEECRWDADHDR